MTINPQPEIPNVVPFFVEFHYKKWDMDTDKYVVALHREDFVTEGLSLAWVIAFCCAEAQNERKNLRCRIFDHDGKIVSQFIARYHGRARVAVGGDGTMVRLYYDLTSWEAKAYKIKVNLGSCDRFAQ